MSETKKCPACAEEIKVEAKKCRFCGEDFNIEQNSKEKVLYTARPHWISYMFSVIVLLIWFAFLPLILVALYMMYYQYSKKIVLTNKKLMYKYWIIKTKTLNLKITKIESVELQGWIFDSLFKVGTIKVYWTWGNFNLIPNISKVKDFHNEIEKIIN